MTEAKYLTDFFPKNSEIRAWARLNSNFNTKKSNFVRKCIEIIVNNKHAFEYFICENTFNV